MYLSSLRHGLTLLLAAAVICIQSGCSAPKPAALKVGINPWPAQDLIWIAEQKGYFRELGLDVQLSQFPGLSDTHAALSLGKIDVAALTNVEVAQSSLALEPIWILDRSVGLDALIGGPLVQAPADLKGKRVGIEPDSLGEVILNDALRLAGLQASDVQIVPLSQGTAEEMMRTGVIDAIVTYPPMMMKVQRLPGTLLLHSTLAGADPVYDMLAVTPAVREARRREIGLLIQGYERALQLLRERPDEVYSLFMSRHRLTREEAELSFGSGIVFFEAAEQPRLLAADGPVARAIEAARVPLDRPDPVDGAP
jgi:NitT/TauT family transport system substrate-binding protein